MTELSVEFGDELDEMKHPPYHLRTNKAVDRLLFVELLRYLNPGQQFTYYSLAGPFLEDLRIMNHFFPEMKLVSLEKSNHTHRRQEFHRFNSEITLLERDFRSFLNSDYDPGESDIFWLDYTNLRYSHLEELQIVLKKVPSGSVVRVTLCAQPDIDFQRLESIISEEEVERIRAMSQDRFVSEFKKVLPHPEPSIKCGQQEFARMVQDMVKRAASEALDIGGSKRQFLPVQAARYDDGTQMLSITGIVTSRAETNDYKTKLENVRFADFDWGEPTLVSVPSLSFKECLALEKYLPVKEVGNPGETLLSVLNYHIGDTRKNTVNQLSQYADFHRDYPRFLRTSF